MQNVIESKGLLLSDAKNFINGQFEELGDFLGDLLLTIEVQAVQDKELPAIPQISCIIDGYAEKADKILMEARSTLGSDIDRLLSNLVLDIEQLTAMNL